MQTPETRYALSGDVNIAYQVVGSGPLDLVFVMGWVSNLEYFWQEPHLARFLRQLASCFRLILFDKRGTGLSDRVPVDDLPTLEQRMDDVRAVMDAVGSERAALMGISEGGPMCALFAATYPERTRGLVMIGSYARRMVADDYPWGLSAEQSAAFLEDIRANWGRLPVGMENRAPTLARDADYRQWWTSYLRMSASPGAAHALTTMNGQIDARSILPTVRVPTLVVHAAGDRAMPVANGRYIAQTIPGARLLELDSDDHLPWISDTDKVVEAVVEFLTGAPHDWEAERVLATVVFTDIVDSTVTAARVGDRRWRALLEEHGHLAGEAVTRFRGRLVKFTGDGMLATFDGPARAIRCALHVADGLRGLGLALRAGLHTGECEVLGDDVGGIAVHIGARIAALARPDEVLVSGTVRDLVAGAGIEFDDRGEKELKGVPGSWRILSVRRSLRAPPVNPAVRAGA